MRILIASFLIFTFLAGCNRVNATQEVKTDEKQLEIPVPTVEEVKNNLSQVLDDMVFVEGGDFMMGDAGDPENGLRWSLGTDNVPAHSVVIDDFYIDSKEVTFGEHDTFSSTTGRTLTLAYLAQLDLRSPDVSAGVTWYDAKAYCQWLGEETGLPFDLPTEAQWEYAARNRGENIPYATDTGYLDIGRNYPKHTRQALVPGQYPPNPLGLYDMSGNVLEWVNDWYVEDYYERSSKNNPQGPASGTLKITRGGCFLESPTGSNVYTRQEISPSKEYKNVGFRCVLNSSDPPEALKKKLEQTLAQKAK